MTEPDVLELALPHVRLSALAWGPVDGPLVVALHGFPDTAWTWRHLGPHLAALGHRVVAPHTRGYAPSQVPDDGCYQVGALMSDAAALHDVLEGDERAVLVGHDWGAITAHGLGAHERSPYRAVVSLAVPPLPALSGVTPGATEWARLLPGQLRRSWYTLFNQLPVLPERTLDRLVAHLWRAWSPGYDGSADVARARAALAARSHRTAALGYYRAVPRTRRLPGTYRDWHRTWADHPRVPTLNLHGEDDGCLGVGLARRAAHRVPPHVRVEIVPSAGHFLQLEQPDTVGGLITDFLRR